MPAQTPEEKAHLETLAPLLSELGCDLRSVFRLPAGFVEEVLAELPGTNAERTKRHLALDALRPPPPKKMDDDAAAALKEYFSQKEARTNEPWRAAARRADLQIGLLTRAFAEPNAFEDLRAEFLNQSKAQLLTELETMILQYLLCAASPDYGRFFLAALLLNVPPASRLQVHNWGVASDMAPGRRDAHGEAIASLTSPLFPDGFGFATLNARLLAEAVSFDGAGRSRVFADRPSGLWGSPLAGGGPLPIYGADGLQTAALDASAVEQQLAAMRSDVSFLRRRLGGRGRGGRGRGRGRGSYRGGGRGAADESAADDEQKN